MARPGKRCRSGGNRAAADRWARWQVVATVARIASELIDRFFGGGGPLHLL